MSSSDSTPVAIGDVEDAVRRDVHTLYARVAGALAENAGPSALTDLHVQDLLALGSRLYADRREAGERFDAFGPGQSEAGLTATDGAIVASALLDAVSVEVFELGIWKTWGTA